MAYVSDGTKAFHFLVCTPESPCSSRTLLCMIGVNDSSFFVGGDRKKHMKVRMVTGSVFVTG